MTDDLIQTLDDPLEALKLAMQTRAAEARERGWKNILVIIKDAIGHEHRFTIRCTGTVRHDRLMSVYKAFLKAPQPIILDVVAKP